MAEKIALTHSTVNRVAYLLATENYYMVFIEGVLPQGHSATRIKKHDVPERCGYVMENSILEASKRIMVVSSWQKPIMGATLNQTCKGAMIASLWKESAEKL